MLQNFNNRLTTGHGVLTAFLFSLILRFQLWIQVCSPGQTLGKNPVQKSVKMVSKKTNASENTSFYGDLHDLKMG